MGLFDSFKKPTVLQDEFFGALRFVEFKDASENYFEGKCYFTPTDSEMGYLIEAGKEGPTEKQKKFYIDLQKDFPKYIQKIKPFIKDEFRNWIEGLEIKDFHKEFKLECITIPRLEYSPIAWDMRFTTIHDSDLYITIDFLDDQPNGILIDS